MRISKFFLAIAASILLVSACATTPEQRTDKAIREVLKEFQAVGISAAIVKDGKTLGVIGVLGPLSMDYAKVLETIEHLCGSVEEIIGGYAPIFQSPAALPPSDKAANDLRKGKNDTDE